MKTKYIKTFEFDKAQYIVSDGNANLLLKVNYKDNRYQIRYKGKKQSELLNEEISEIAEDLLQRKHGKNFAEQKTV